MFWIVLTAIIIGSIIASFTQDWKRQNKVLSSEGGVEKKYSELIRIMSANSNPTVYQSDTETYLFGWVTPNADNRFRITQTFQYVNIKLQFKGRITFLNKTITLSKEWKFPEDTNQEFMANKVLKEMNEKFENSELGGF